MEDRIPIVDIFSRRTESARCRGLIFMRNHRRDHARDGHHEEREIYMYRVYAIDRQARIKLWIRRRRTLCCAKTDRKIEWENERLDLLAAGTRSVLRRRDRHGRQNLPAAIATGVRRRCSGSPIRNAG